ncbi:hypothetical protein [Halanaeroarchaeum sulfurireducens]|uniref:hypothetical protein n=1 Tax=Halanaeroarchaeum sulfurireducens TaxID=1604004 RepID=UPI0006787DFE|nr:hypothetical protein [Halanaeroarchaeum sulfurireducens]
MGSATRTRSPSSQAGYDDAKELMQEAAESGHAQAAVDVGVKAALAVQPNGPSKYLIYTYTKHTAKLVQESQKNGVESGIKAVGQDIVTSELAGAAGDELVNEAQNAVSQAAQEDIVKQGTSGANKNLSNPVEMATKAAISETMSQGANALITDTDDE